MVNHAMCLLINKNYYNFSSPNNEYIDREFEEIRILPNYLKLVKNILFTSDPDDYLLSYRCTQFLSILHNDKKFEELILERLDPRITYDLNKSIFSSRKDLYFPKVTLGDKEKCQLFGKQTINEENGKIKYNLEIEITGASQIIIRNNINQHFIGFDVTYDNQWTNENLPLFDTGYFLKIKQSPVGTKWKVEFLIKPKISLLEITKKLKEQMNDEIYYKLFGFNEKEPYKFLSFLWSRSKEIPSRLGSLVLTYLLRLEELRKNRV